jgi:hypothetical protein
MLLKVVFDPRKSIDVERADTVEGLVNKCLLLAPDRPCAQHVQSTRRMSLTVKRQSTKGLPFVGLEERCIHKT